jgi:transcriptional regulator with XRE-family HTH domain
MESELLNGLDQRQLGDRLKDARKARGLTQEAVATKLGILRTTLVAIEKGERRITPSELIEISKMYGRRVSEFVSNARTKSRSFRSFVFPPAMRVWRRTT